MKKSTARLRAAAMVWGGLAAQSALAVDFTNVEAIGYSQPSINAALSRSPTGDVLYGTGVDSGGDPINDFRVQQTDTIPFDILFLDTGASGILLSTSTADRLGVQRLHYPTAADPLVEVADFGIAGGDAFNVSEQLYITVAPDYGSFDTFDGSRYSLTSGPVRAQIGPLSPDPALQGLLSINLAGMPAMMGHVTVMNPSDPTAFSPGTSMSTFIYTPGTPFNAATADTDPGIPSTAFHVALSYGDFAAFTQVTPAGAPKQTLNHNPFVGTAPVVDTASPGPGGPGVTVTLGDKEAVGSFLLDTGAQGSILSEALAAQINVRYRDGTFGTDHPVLELFDPAHPELQGTALPDQFTTSLSGVGGSFSAAGFYLDSLVLQTVEGVTAGGGLADPANLRYLHVPITVRDVSFVNGDTNELLTLDGILGMNLFAASGKAPSLNDPTQFGLDDATGVLGGLTASKYKWIVFDEPNGTLGLELAAAPVPVPAGGWLLLMPSVLLLRRRASRA